MVPGGKGANQAVAAARLSPPGTVEFFCKFGNDAHANTLASTLKENQLEIAGCTVSDKPSGQAFIFIYENGENSIILSAAANAAWPVSPEPGLLEKVSSAKAFFPTHPPTRNPNPQP